MRLTGKVESKSEWPVEKRKKIYRSRGRKRKKRQSHGRVFDGKEKSWGGPYRTYLLHTVW